jgi:hypothetical protein
MRSRTTALATPAAALSLLVALPVAAVVLATPAGAAVPVTCGDTVTGDAYLASDLVCAGSGIRLTGDATLDLAGHTLDGTGATGAGITFTLEGTQTVTNGAITAWGTAFQVDYSGIDPDGEPGDGMFVLSDLRARGNRLVVSTEIDSLFSGNRATFDVGRSRFEQNGTVFAGLWGGDVDAHDSEFVDNGTVMTFDSGGGAIRTSYLEGNDAVIGSLVEASVFIEDSVLVDNTTVAGGAQSFMSYVEIARSEVRGSDTVITANSEFTRLVDNTFTDNGIVVDLGEGSGQIARNTFENNVLAFTSVGPPLDGPWSSPARLEGNTFLSNGDAIITAGVGTELKDNVAQYSTGWGIYAPGVTDLGGNKASGNGRDPQCVGVVCTGHPHS